MRRTVPLLVLLACAAPVQHARPPGAAQAAPAPPLPRVSFEGGDAGALPLAEAALRQVFATPIGRQARDLLDSGVMGPTLHIELNRRGENFTHYRVPGRELDLRIAFDPTHRPLVQTEQGLLPASPETVLAHELGHALFKLVEEEVVIQAVENPLREQLGLPRRSRF